MIFVTVGTHEQPFDRLIEGVDLLKQDGRITDEVVMQTGYSTYKPKCCAWQKFYPYQQMLKFVEEARIVITHGGPSSFIMPLQIGKIPIVVPRRQEYNEHVNDHQEAFAKAAAMRMGNIIVVEDVAELADTIQNYEKRIREMGNALKSNNAKFNVELSRIVDEMFGSETMETNKEYRND